MAAIDIGNEAINRDSYIDYNKTLIDGTNTANASGRLTSVSVYANVEMLNSVVAIFYRPDSGGHPNNFTARDSQSLGTVPAGLSNHDVDLEVEEGDYIGIYFFGQGRIDSAVSGGLYWNIGSNQTEADDVEFSAPGDAIISLGAIGFEPTTPTVTTQAAAGIKNVYITGNGNITNEGYANIIERGFEYGLAEEAQFSVKQTGTDLGGGAYTLTVDGLDPETTYYYRAYATNSEGVGYGSWVSFTTVASPDYGMYEQDNTATLCFYVRRFGGKWSKKYGPYTTDKSDIVITDILTE